MEGRTKGIIMGILNIIIALALLSIIITGTAAILAANVTNLTGISSLAPLIPTLFVIGQLVKGGWMTWSSARGNTSDVSVRDQIIGIVVQYLAIVLFPVIIGFLNTAITAAGGPAATTYPALATILGILGMVLLVGIMVMGFMVERSGVSFRKSKKSKR